MAINSFGGPAGQIAVMHTILVEEKKWVDEDRFLHALNYCMLLPGPEAQQLATYIGWLLHKTRGGLVAGGLFILPGFLSILGLSILYALYRDLKVVEAIFFGIKPAVLAVVVSAVFRIGGRALRTQLLIALAGLAFLAIFAFGIPFPWIVIGAGLLGMIASRSAGAAAEAGPAAREAAIPDHMRPSLSRAVRVTLICLLLWAAAPLGSLLLFGGDSVFLPITLFFSRMAVVTFGGAYAALAWVAQEAVNAHGWLTHAEMLDGLGLAETTPGPLIMVLEFVGFLAAFRNPGALPPLAAGVIGAVLTTWVTFVPCFLWIFLGGPYIESLRGNRRLADALKAITAAVVGVILNLAVWFAVHTLFGAVVERSVAGLKLPVPEWRTLDPAAAAIAAAALVAMLRFRTGVLVTLAGGVVAGLLFSFVMGR